MPRSFRRFCLMIVVILATFLTPLGAGCLSQQHRPGSKQEDSIRKFLRKFVRDSAGTQYSHEGVKEEYFSAFVDLNDDGTQEAIVYLISDWWCGSGGCTTLILAPEGSSYRVVTKTTITHLPIRVLSTKSNGWHDLAVWVQGGGIVHAYEAKLSFNGKTYPSNPSMPPARRLTKHVPGEVVVYPQGERRPLN